MTVSRPAGFIRNSSARTLHPAHLEKWASSQALFNMELISHLPRLEWEEFTVKTVKKHRGDSIDYDLTVRFRNAGKLPTALSQAHLVKIVRPDEVRIKFENASDSVPRYRLLEPAPAPGRRESMMMSEDEGRRPGFISATAGYHSRRLNCRGSFQNQGLWRIELERQRNRGDHQGRNPS